MDFTEIKKRLLKLDTTSLCDADKKIRTIDPAIRPVRPDLKLIGRAHTVQYLTVIKALHDAAAGEVLVVNGQGGCKALAGEMFTTEACRKGLAGMIIDGFIRDIKAVRKLNFPVYFRSIFPISGSANKIFETQIPISCGGITIHPGDILLGDGDGVIAVSDAEIVAITKMKKGESLLEMLNFKEHFSNVKAKKASKLGFKF